MELFSLPDPAPRPAAPAPPQVYSVSEITQAVRTLLEESIGQVWVEGEVSNYRRQASGHQYFTLKDETCQLSCVLFARQGAWKRASVPLADGMQVVVRGLLTVYPQRGQYQLNVQLVQADGAGLLQARFEALKRKLEGEGLFDVARKRTLPRFPAVIGIVTSPTGAALRDILNVLARRAPWLRVIVSPVRVQGEGACDEIAAAVEELNALDEHGLPLVDAIVVARGGGSVEDLWAFNEEVVARAIARSLIPVVSAVGHEIDFTIADFVADLRAPTPSAAAELIAPDTAELARRVVQLSGQMTRRLTGVRDAERQRLQALARSALFREPRARLDEAAQRLDFAAENLRRTVREWLAQMRERITCKQAVVRQYRPDQLLVIKRQQFEAAQARMEPALRCALAARRHQLECALDKLRLLSPQATLERGYSLTFDGDGALVRTAAKLSAGKRMRTRFADGDVESVVE
jgi:exodeoxyribonuclease VII large subunit